MRLEFEISFDSHISVLLSYVNRHLECLPLLLTPLTVYDSLSLSLSLN